MWHFKSQHFTISLTVQHYRTSLLNVSALGSFWRPHWCLPAVRFAAFTVKENFLSDLRCRHNWELILGRNRTAAPNVKSLLPIHPFIWDESTFKNSFGEKLYSCSQCSKLFTTSSGLQVYLRTNSGEKSYSCSQCSKLFTTSSGLQVYLRTNSGEKSYSYSRCSKSFTTSSGLQAHLIYPGEKPYSCLQCSKLFTTSSGMKIHLNIHSGRNRTAAPNV